MEKDMSGGTKITDPINQTTRLKEQNFDIEKNFNSSKDPNNSDKKNNSGWSWFSNSLKTLKNSLYGGFQTTRNSLLMTLNSVYANTSNTILYTWDILKNPIVFLNAVIGLSLISAILLGYIKYEKRFLMGKPNSFIWTCLFGTTTLLTFDYYLLNKYFIKKSK